MTELQITTERMEAMDIEQLEQLYMDTISDELVPLMSDSISDAMDNYDEEVNSDICIMVDFKEQSLVFAYGVANDLKSSQDSQVFYTHEISLLRECHKMLQYLIKHDTGYSMDTQISDWLTDAVLHANYALDDYDVYIYGGYDYTVPSWWYDPFYDPEHRG